MTVKTERGTREIVCASAYFPGDVHEAPPKTVQELIQHCQKAKIPYLIGCDANAHHTVWGSTDINDRGESLLNFLIDENVQILNRGNRPTFINAIRAEVLELTLCSANLYDLVVGWHVSDEHCFRKD